MADDKPYTKTELAELYGVSRKVLRAWLKPFQKQIGAYNGRCYTIAQITIIFECLGRP